MTTLNLQVAASADDAHEGGGGVMNLTNAVVYIYDSSYWGGVRFQNVTVPQAATINSAPLQIDITSATYDDVYVDVYGEDEDSASQFTTDNGDISGRTPTTAKTSKSETGAGAGWYSIDMATAVKEIIDRGGWSSGNNLALLLDGTSGVSLKFTSYDGDSADAAKLDIDYVAAAAGIAGPLVGRVPVGSLVHGGLV